QDLKPYIYKTNDYGQNWQKIVNGLDDPHSFARVVREDKKVKGQLYAGTETGLYISTDDGKNWTKFQGNLPVVPINDLTIRNNDLVVATAGRSFWILDDVNSLQNRVQGSDQFKLIKPLDAPRFFNGSTDQFVPGLGQNPKAGVAIDYYIGEKSDSLDLKLQVLQNGKVIREITNKPPKDFKSWPGGPGKPEVLPAKEGYNRYYWDFSRDPLPAVENVFVYGSYSGYSVGPGDYTIKMFYNGAEHITTTTVLPNPNIEATAADYKEQQEVLQSIATAIKNIHNSVSSIRSAQKQLKTYKSLLKDNEAASELVKKGDSLIKRIDKWEQQLIQPKQETFQDVINFQNMINAEFMELMGYVDSPDPKVTQGAKQRLQDLLSEWRKYEKEKNDIINNEMAEYNQMYDSLGLPAIIYEEK
ncbi:MAG: glycosyl hydrolase, partial [Flavobacteriaceae bacterium]|nr:glycosyl hydrolase [Flavobacteriaceae bacterium]